MKECFNFWNFMGDNKNFECAAKWWLINRQRQELEFMLGIRSEVLEDVEKES